MHPTPATARRVALSVCLLIIGCLAMAASLNRAPRGQFTGIMLGISSGLLTFLLLVVISRQPLRRRGVKTPQSGPNTSVSELETTASTFFQYSVIPWVPAGAVFLHCCLLLQALELAATPFAFWFAIGKKSFQNSKLF